MEKLILREQKYDVSSILKDVLTEDSKGSTNNKCNKCAGTSMGKLFSILSYFWADCFKMG